MGCGCFARASLGLNGERREAKWMMCEDEPMLIDSL